MDVNREAILEKERMGEKDLNLEGDKDALEAVLSHIGEMGRYQKLLFLAMGPLGFTFAFVYFIQMFITATPQNHWCHVPEMEHLNAELRRNLSIPKTLTGDYERCLIYNANWSQVLETMTPPHPDTPTKRCPHGWEFHLSDIPFHTVVSERGWVCEHAKKVPISSATFFAGSIVGTLLFGSLADVFGRVPALIGANLIGCFGGIASVFTNSFWDYALCRFLVGLSYDSCFMMMYILALEYVGSGHRTWVANMSIAIYFGGACMVLPWLAIWISDWRKLVLATSLPMLIVLAAPCVVPESARWLASRRRTDKALAVLRKFERVNKRKIPQDLLDEFILSTNRRKTSDETVTVTTLFTSPRLRTMVLLMVVSYISIAIVFDGLVRMSENMGLDFFITFTLAAATEIPSLVLLTFVLDRWGRRFLMCGSVTFAGVMTVIAAFVPKGLPQAGLAICARFFVNMSFNTIMQWSTEVLPTPVRASGTSIMHVSGFAGGLISPFVVYSERMWAPLPLLVMGITSLLACGMGIMLPETMGRRLPQTTADGELLINNYSLCGSKLDAEDSDTVNA
ncbi:organic cation transporter protein-like [Hyposmocoma kahamanoa]|uniref:organic cation transporter protein-like n=1 Tax=Hyposmocoma kahamanoa TaxID=1477025 RepID=UPI000E6D5D06|nr:organic cation transporter protein-like [Hyposmocoma kahamanoa]